MDIRHEAARFYDHQDFPIADVDFYIQRIPSPEASVLELGCGTGRVLVPLAAHCAYILGIDHSEGMLEICREKLAAAGLPQNRAKVEVGDAANLDLGRKFDLITAPFRVFQLMVEDTQVDGFFATLRRHLAPGGSAIINTFRPNGTREEIAERNSKGMSRDEGETPFGEGRVARSVYIRAPVTWEGEKFVFYPMLVYRYFIGGELREEAEMEIAMRIWYPEQLLALAKAQGFAVVSKWGGYEGEIYGEGGELVLELQLPGIQNSPS